MIRKSSGKCLISIIIPTYKRNKKLKELINSLIEQAPKEIKIEIIIIGNKKINFKSSNHLILKKNIKLKSILIKKNSNAIKRNIGLKFARGSNLILIDDDCLPEKNFIKNYIQLFKKIKDRDILCGSVKYLKTKVKKENFTRYRQSRHFIINTNNLNKKNYLSAKQIVTMNMGMKNSKLLKRTKYFNEKFGGYGFEDYEFGYRLIKQGFKFIASKPVVYHLDERNYKEYLGKIYFLSRYSVSKLKAINHDSWKDTIYFKIENNLIVNFLSKVKLINVFFENFEKLIEFIEKNIFLYLPKLYRFGIFLSYCRGYYDRKVIRNYKNYEWYK